MEDIDISKSVIGQDLDIVKKIVKLLKKAPMNVYMTDGFALIQEAEKCSALYMTLHSDSWKQFSIFNPLFIIMTSMHRRKQII